MHHVVKSAAASSRMLLLLLGQASCSVHLLRAVLSTCCSIDRASRSSVPKLIAYSAVIVQGHPPVCPHAACRVPLRKLETTAQLVRLHTRAIISRRSDPPSSPAPHRQRRCALE